MVYSILVASVMTVRVLCVTGDTQGTQVVYSILIASVMTVRVLYVTGDTQGTCCYSQGVMCDRRH